MIAFAFPPIGIEGVVGRLREARHDGGCAVVPPMHGKEKKSVGGSSGEERKLVIARTRSRRRKINRAHRPARRYGGPLLQQLHLHVRIRFIFKLRFTMSPGRR